MINNEFWNFIRFIKPIEGESINFFEPKEQLGQLIAKSGDNWRFLIPKSDLHGKIKADASIGLVKKEWLIVADDIVCCLPQPDFEPQIGTIRSQNCENYTEIKLLIGETPDGVLHRQFSLNNSSGKSIFGTFSSNKTDRYEYLKDLKKHFEGCFFTNVFVDVNGSLMTIRAYTNNRFRLSDEKCTISIGNVTEKNSNNPSIESRFIENVIIPAKYRFDLDIQNIAVGNILILGSKTKIVQNGDTISSLKDYLLGGIDYYEVLQTDNIIASSSKGTYQIINTEKPKVESLFQSNIGFDRYKIAVSGNYSVGNAIQVTSAGKTPINYTVKSTDTIASITTALNPNGSNLYYDVPTGTIINISVFEGVQSVDNTNSLVFNLTNRVSVASRNVDKYQCYIGDDIMERNYFKVYNEEYYAKEGDTPLDVAIGLGYSARQFTVEMPSGVTLQAYATQGYMFGESNISDIRIIQQPKIKVSSQYVCEASFPNLVNGTKPSGEYYLAIWSKLRGEVMALGNSVRFADNICDRETSIIEFFDKGTIYNHEYFEQGLTQVLRVPVMLSQPKRQVEENRVITINGGIERAETNITEYRNFVTRGIENSMMRALQVAMRHTGLLINGERYAAEGEISDEYVDDYINYGQNSGKLLRFGKNSNNVNQLITNELYKGYGRIIINTPKSDLRVLIIDDSFGLDSNSKKELLVTDSVLVATGEYQVVIDNPTNNIGLKIYQDDILQRNLLILGNSRNRLKGFQRLNSNGTLKFDFYDISSNANISFGDETNIGLITNITYTFELKGSEGIGDFSIDFNNDFN